MNETMIELNAPPKIAKQITPTKCIKLVGESLELRSGGFIASSNQRIVKGLCYLVFMKLAGGYFKKQMEKLD